MFLKFRHPDVYDEMDDDDDDNGDDDDDGDDPIDETDDDDDDDEGDEDVWGCEKPPTKSEGAFASAFLNPQHLFVSEEIRASFRVMKMTRTVLENKSGDKYTKDSV